LKLTCKSNICWSQVKAPARYQDRATQLNQSHLIKNCTHEI
jgi:hypothetical protein